MDKLRGLVARRANEIENLATKGWLDKPNAEFLFREITNKAREIQAALLASLPVAAYPRPCGLCPRNIESAEDMEWHGLGNCVPICERCDGSGIEPSPSVTRPTPATRPNEIDIVKKVLSAYQTAYAQAHCAERKTVIESDGIAIGYASVELAKLLAGSQDTVLRQSNQKSGQHDS